MEKNRFTAEEKMVFLWRRIGLQQKRRFGTGAYCSENMGTFYSFNRKQGPSVTRLSVPSMTRNHPGSLAHWFSPV